MISRFRWVLFMCSVLICLVACSGGDTDPAATTPPASDDTDELAPHPIAGFAEVAGLRGFIEDELELYDEFLRETVSETWQNDWTAYDNSLADFAAVSQLFAGTNPLAPGTLVHYFQSAYPQLNYATITLEDLDLPGSPRTLDFSEDLTLGGSETNPNVNVKQKYHLAKARMYWGVKDVEFEGNDPAKPYVPLLMLVDEVWWRRDGPDGEPLDWVSREYLLVFEGKLFAYGVPRVGSDSIWPFSNGVPGDAFEGRFLQIRLADFLSNGELTVNSETQLVRSEYSYLLRQTRDYGGGSLLADVEPNDQSGQAQFVPIGYSSGTESHSLQEGHDDADQFLITALAGCNDPSPDTDPECGNPVVLPTRIDVSTSDPTAQLRLELIDAEGGFALMDNNEIVAAGGNKFIIFDQDHIQRNSSSVSYGLLTIGQKLLVKVSLLNAGDLPVNYRLSITSQE